MPNRLLEVSLRVISFITEVTIVVSCLIADGLIWLMLNIRRGDERRIRPTKRVTWPKGLKRQLMRRQDNTCVYCGYRRRATSMDIDHIVPAVKGGSNDISNLQVICRPCNQRKSDQTDEEFRTRYGRLVPPTLLTPPRRRISQAEFKAETQRTSPIASVQQFRRTKFISKREKISGGCMVSGVAVAILVAWGLASSGLEGLLLALPAAALGGLVGFGVWFRAQMTGVMIEDDE